MYASAQDLKDRYPAKVLKELTDEAGLVIDDNALTRAIGDASVEIDGYLNGRYALPLADPPEILKLYACEIAFYRLMKSATQEAIEDVKQRYDAAIRYLTRVSRGEIQLSLAADGNPAPQTDGPMIITGSRQFTRDGMRGL